MKFIIAIIFLAFSGMGIAAGAKVKQVKDPPAFHKIKSLAGTWNGKSEDGKTVVLSYQVLSAGSIVMETMNTIEDHTVMVTMYHMDGKRLMMTHYSATGNQPRLKASSLNDTNKIAFSLIDITNLSSAKEGYLKKLVFTFRNADHFSQEWRLNIGGTLGPPQKFVFEKSK